MTISTSIKKNALLAKLHRLPSLPGIVLEVIASLRETDPNFSLLVNKIARDQGLSAKILRVANSSFYGLSRKVGSIQDAATVVGFDCIRSVVLSAGMAKIFPHSQNNLFDITAYWQRSFRVAAISMAQAKNFRQDPQLAFTAGMFYDIGQLVLNECAPQLFAEILQQRTPARQDLIEIERSLFGFDHAEIGAELIRLWNFPQEIEQAVRYWHQPELLTTIDPMVCVVHLAALLESGLSGEALMNKLSQTCCDRMQMTWERIEACLPQPNQLAATTNLLQAN